MTRFQKAVVVIVALPMWVFVFFQIYTTYKMPRAMVVISDGKIGHMDPRQFLSKAEQDPKAFDTPEMLLALGMARRAYRDVVGGGILYGILSSPCAYILLKCSLALRRRIVAGRGAEPGPRDH